MMTWLRTIALSAALTVAPGALAGTIGVPGDFATIQQAIDAAVSGDEILVAAGAYAEQIDLLGKSITVRSTGGPGVTIIDGAGGGPVVTCASGESALTELEGFTITGGSATDGAGLRVVGSGPRIVNCSFVACAATGMGGAIATEDASPLILQCSFSSNTAGGLPGGGAIACTGASAPVLFDCQFTGNMALAGSGGAIAVDGTAAEPTIQRSTFDTNTSLDDGGAILISGGASARIIECVFTANESGEDGGAIASEASSPTIENCRFIGNSSGDDGGGLTVEDEGVARVTNCRFIDNSAADSGGGARSSSNSNPRYTNCTFIGNEAIDTGGGLSSSSSQTFIINCSFTENTCGPNGGAITASTGGTVTVINSIVWGNTPFQIIGLATVSWSNVQGSGGPPTGNIDADPLFTSVLDDDLTLQAGSPCIDAGSTSAADDCHTDLAYNERFADDPATLDTGIGGPPVVDMGAFEFQAADVIDCNLDGILDDCALLNIDCNGNGAPDDCDIETGPSADCNGNHVPDECETDCNGNGVPDECDIFSGASPDTNGNGIPDECDPPSNDTCDSPMTVGLGITPFTTALATSGGPAEPDCPFFANDVWFAFVAPCTGASTADFCNTLFDTRVAIYDACPGGPGTVIACNNDGVCAPASTIQFAVTMGNTYLIRVGALPGVTGDGFLRMLCGPLVDCNGNGIPDGQELADDAVDDCNANSVPDSCDVASGTSEDCNGNGRPDECEPSQLCTGDADCSGAVDVDDLVRVILDWGMTDADGDVNDDGIVDVDDLVTVILNWGEC